MKKQGDDGQLEERKEAVLLMAYGSPDKEEDVEAYYTHIRGGRKPTPEEVENLISRYKKIGRSPLLGITSSVAVKLESRLEKGKVFVGMKHWHPFIAESFGKISSSGITDLVSIALAPHFSKMSIGSYQESVRMANVEHGNRIKINFVDSWHMNPIFIEKWNQRILRACREKFDGVKMHEIFFLFTAHSLPERILTWNDPYKDQLLETTNKLASDLKLQTSQFGLAFQSAGHTTEPWLGPDILDELKTLNQAGWRQILVIPIGFVSDHLEILFDIDVEAKDLSKELGIHLERTDSFNDSNDFIEILRAVVAENKR